MSSISSAQSGGGFLKNALTLMFGSGASQLIPFAISLVLSRLYSTAEFGTFTVFASLVSFLSVFATMRYEVAIMLPKRHTDALHLLVLSFIIAAGLSVLVLLLSILFPHQIALWLSLPALEPWLIWLGLSVFLSSGIQILVNWFNRQKQYRRISTTMVAQSATTAAVNTGNGFAGFTSGGLIIGSLSGQLLAFVRLLFYFRRSSGRHSCKISRENFWKQAREYADFPKFSFPHRLVDMISLTGLPLLISLLFSATTVGLYGFMLRVMKAPLAVLASSLGQVFYQEFSARVAAGKQVRALFRRTVLGVALLILPFFVVLMLYGPDIFAWVFSEKWRRAGVFAQYLSPWLFFSTIASPVSQVPLTLKKVKHNMFAGIANNVLLVAIFVAASLLFGKPEAVFLSIGLLMPLFYVGLLYWYFRLITNYEAEGKS